MKTITHSLLILIFLTFASCNTENIPEASFDLYEVAEMAVVAGDAEIFVSWVPSSERVASGFYVKWVPDNTALSIGEIILPSGDNSYLIKDLVNDETYQVSVQAIYGDKKSGAVSKTAKPAASRL
jgi:hypothetical protein